MAAVVTIDDFAGWGGLTKGASYVPGVEPGEGHNHDQDAVDAFQLSFPNAKGVCADVTRVPPEKMRRADCYLAAPSCPPHANAAGVKRIFDAQSHNQPTLFEGLAGAEDSRMQAKQEERRRGRLLMHEPVRYLRAHHDRGQPVLIGMLENVPEARSWEEWDLFIGEFRKMGYKTQLIPLRASHARPVRSPWAPTDRDRLFLAYWHESLGRDPNWDKWLRPNCWCSVCETWVLGVLTWKRPGIDMGVYREQYLYRCPNHHGKLVPADPEVHSALSILDTSDPGTRLDERARPLVDATILRLANGVGQHWLPLLAGRDGEAWRAGPGVRQPGLPGDVERFITPGARVGYAGQAVLPFITRHRGGGDRIRAFPASAPTSTFSAQGNHQGVALVPDMNDAELWSWAQTLLVPYFGNSTGCRSAVAPVGTLTTRDRYGVARMDDFAEWESQVGNLPDLTRVPVARLRELLAPMRFRMLNRQEKMRSMGYDDTMRSPSKSDTVWTRLIGNSVAVPCGEIIVSALVECLTGEELERDPRIGA